MAVYTSISRKELEEFLRRYPVKNLVDYHGISSGVENTNYFVTTEDGQWVLTLFETVEPEALPFCLALTDFLASQGLPSAAPLRGYDGNFIHSLRQRQAALVHRLQGQSLERPDAGQCAAIGLMLARLHIAGQGFNMYRKNSRGPHWWACAVEKLRPHLSARDKQIIEDEMRIQKQISHAGLPRGVIHGDLFVDNALFKGGMISGIIDFYFACHDVLIFDVAVTVNDWCRSGDGSINESRFHSLSQAYNSVRPINDQEQRAWNLLLRAAALRFWLSRLLDIFFPRPGALTQQHDPNEFLRLLLWHRDHQLNLPSPAFSDPINTSKSQA